MNSVDNPPDPERVPDEDESLADGRPYYTGTWELKRRSPVAAAFFGMLLIGLVYMIGQVVLIIPPLLFTAADHVGDLNSGEPSAADSVMGGLLGPLRVVLVIAQFAFMLAPVIWLVKRWHTRQVRDYIRWKNFRPPEVLLAVLITLLLLPTSSYILSLIVRSLDVPDSIARMGEELFTAHSPGEFIWLVFVVAVTPAICEEVLFRGYVQRTMERGMGKKAIFVAGVAFGLFHFSPLGLAVLAIMGIVLGYFYRRSRSIFPSMASHFTNNLLAVWLLYEQPVIGDVNLASDASVPFSWVLATFPVAVALLFLYHRITRGRGDLSEPAEEQSVVPRGPVALLSPEPGEEVTRLDTDDDNPERE